MKSFKRFIREDILPAKNQNRFSSDDSIKTDKNYNEKRGTNPNFPSDTNKETKSSSLPYKQEVTDRINRTITGKQTTRLSPMEYNNMTPWERQKQNNISSINDTIKSTAPIKGIIDARTNEPYQSKSENVPLTGRVGYNPDRTGIISVSDRPGSANEPASVSSDSNQTTIVKKGPSIPQERPLAISKRLSAPDSIED